MYMFCVHHVVSDRFQSQYLTELLEMVGGLRGHLADA